MAAIAFSKFLVMKGEAINRAVDFFVNKGAKYEE
jgi:hypothetical protein